MYLISIIIPVYNVEETLDLAFDSIFNQTLGFDKLEIIFVNDCSTDNSYNIIQDFSSKYDNVKVYSTRTNSGNAGQPRNIGLKYASSDYIMFLDPDDYYNPTACEDLYNKIKLLGFDMVMGSYNILSKNKTRFVSKDKLNLKNNELIVNSYRENYELFTIAPSIWAKIFRKDFILINNLRFKEEYAGEDLYFVYESLFLAEGICYINKAIVNYVKRDYTRIKEKSITDRRDYKTMSGFLKAYEDTYNLMQKYEASIAHKCLNHLNYWIKLLIDSNLDDDAKLNLFYEAKNLFSIYEEYHFTKSYANKTLLNNIFENNYLNALEIINILNIDTQSIIRKIKKFKIIFLVKDYEEYLVNQLKILSERKYNFQVIYLEKSYVNDDNFSLNIKEYLEKNEIEITDNLKLYDKKRDTSLIFNNKQDFIKYIIEIIKINEDKTLYLITDIDITDTMDFKDIYLTKLLSPKTRKENLEQYNNSYDTILTFYKTKKQTLKQHLILPTNKQKYVWEQLFIKTYTNNKLNKYDTKK